MRAARLHGPSGMDASPTLAADRSLLASDSARLIAALRRFWCSDCESLLSPRQPLLQRRVRQRQSSCPKEASTLEASRNSSQIPVTACELVLPARHQKATGVDCKEERERFQSFSC